MEIKCKSVPIKGFEGMYEVYENSDIKSIERKVLAKNGSLNPRGGKILRPADNGKGYKFVYLWKNNKSYRKYIHILVAEAFIPNPYNKPEVNHIDTIKSHNFISNLEWATESENMYHSYLNGIHKSGENHPNSKLSDISRIEILKDYADNDLGQKSTASFYNVSNPLLSRLIKNYIATHLNDELSRKLISKISRNLKR